MKTSVDKFGHYKGIHGKPGPPGNGFQLTPAGDYDMQNKILANVKDGNEEGDAVSIRYFKRGVADLPYFDPSREGISCRKRRFVDVAPPKDDSDGVNLEFLKTNTLHCMDNAVFDVKAKRVKGLPKPEEPSEAVNKEFLGEKLKEVADSIVGLTKKIKDVGDNTMHLDRKENAFNARKHCLKDVGDGKRDNDAVNIKFLKTWLKIHGYLHQRELADAVINLRREINGLHKVKKKPAEVQDHLNNIEDSFKRTWRTAVQEGAGAFKTKYEPVEKQSILTNFNIGSELWDLYHRE